MNDLRNRTLPAEPDWVLPVEPIIPPEGFGIAFPACRDRTDLLIFPIRTGVGMRIGGEANLCFRCGPEGSVYHPGRYTVAEGSSSDQIYTMDDLRALIRSLPQTVGYDPDDLTPEVMAAYDAQMRAAFANEREREARAQSRRRRGRGEKEA